MLVFLNGEEKYCDHHTSNVLVAFADSAVKDTFQDQELLQKKY